MAGNEHEEVVHKLYEYTAIFASLAKLACNAFAANAPLRKTLLRAASKFLLRMHSRIINFIDRFWETCKNDIFDLLRSLQVIFFRFLKYFF